MPDLTDERLRRLADLLAHASDSIIDVTTPRPMPDIGEALVVGAVLRFVREHIGKGDAAAIEQIFQGVFERHAGVSAQLSQIWDRYGSDESFLAFVQTLVRKA